MRPPACTPPASLRTGSYLLDPTCLTRRLLLPAVLPVRAAARARQLAAALTKAGFKPKDRLGIYMGEQCSGFLSESVL